MRIHLELDPLRLMEKLREQVKQNYRGKVKYDALLRAAINEVNANLDPFGKNEIYAPCDYRIRLPQTDVDELKRIGKFALYQQKLEKAVQEHIRDKGYLTMEKTIRLSLEPDEGLDSGYYQVDIAFKIKDDAVGKTIIRPPSGQALAYVEWLNGPRKGEQIPIIRNKVLLGRITEDNHPDVGLEDKRNWVGRRHAEIEQRGNAFFLRALSVVNRTEVETPSGSQIVGVDAPIELTDQACIVLAEEYRLLFRLSDRLETKTQVRK
jgi:hypothetical protein